MTLNINKVYLLSTKGGSVTEKQVRVIATLGYEAALKVGYDLQVAAIYEKVISDVEQSEDYFINKEFYHVKDINNNTEYLVWEDIIEYTKTTILVFEYQGVIKLKTSQTLDVPISTVVSNIENYVKTTYGDKVTPNIVIGGVGSEAVKTDAELLAEKIAKYESILTEFEKLSAIIPAIAKIEEIDLMSIVSQIEDSISSINDNIGTISSNLS